MSKTLFRSSLAAALLVGFAGAAQAQAINDRWEISGSYFRPDVSVTLSGQGTATDGCLRIGPSLLAQAVSSSTVYQPKLNCFCS